MRFLKNNFIKNQLSVQVVIVQLFYNMERDFFFKYLFCPFIIMQVSLFLFLCDLFFVSSHTFPFYRAVWARAASGNKILHRGPWRVKSSRVSIVLWHKRALALLSGQYKTSESIQNRQHYTFLFVNFLLIFVMRINADLVWGKQSYFPS